MKLPDPTLIDKLEAVRLWMTGRQYRVRRAPDFVKAGSVELQYFDDAALAWFRMPWAAARRKYDAGDAFWEAWRPYGIYRPSPPGTPSKTSIPEAKRKTARVVLRLRPEAATRFRSAARKRGMSLSAFAEWLLDAPDSIRGDI